MKYMVTWHERPMGSAGDYEGARARILDLFRHWETPAELRIQSFLVRLGEAGGFMIEETEDPLALHRMTASFPAFRFAVDPVLDIEPALGAELEAVAWRAMLPAMAAR